MTDKRKRLSDVYWMQLHGQLRFFDLALSQCQVICFDGLVARLTGRKIKIASSGRATRCSTRLVFVAL